MTIAQADRFYEQDKKKYEINKNKDLLLWLKKTSRNRIYPIHWNWRITRLNQ